MEKALASAKRNGARTRRITHRKFRVQKKSRLHNCEQEEGMRKAMSKEVGAGGKFDIFLDSEAIKVNNTCI